MKKSLSLALCITLTLFIVNSVSACWVYLSIEEMEQQAELIVIGELTGDIREVVRDDGSGVTFWSLQVEHVLKGESGPILEVVTGGLVTKEPKVMISTDYRLDNLGELFLLYLDEQDGVYSPVTPRGIVALKRSEAGEIFMTYAIKSDQHQDEHEDILASVSRNKDGLLKEKESGAPHSSNTNRQVTGTKPVLLGLGALIVASVVGFLVWRT